ncbi:MAG: zinc-binding dehydrogenase [Acidimicrobiaceae bacterium]|nr:zinc-binding dehydrogenase [Acidimicrobiaceae bacterium]
MVVREDVPDPVPALGQILIDVQACGICGSDLHFARFGRTMLDLAKNLRGLPDLGTPVLDMGRDVFMGHEFSGEVLEVGPDTIGPPPGTLVTSIPLMVGAQGPQGMAYTNDLPAGYGERMLLSAPLVLEVPNGLDARRAALTEPMAVGVHAVNRAQITGKQGAIVIGSGPVGLAVIAALRLRGVEPVVAADFSSARRALASTMGAQRVVDPAQEDVFDAWAAEAPGRPVVVFEAVGVGGMIDEIFRSAPLGAQVVVVGVCMGSDAVTPFYAISKELDVHFALAYTPEEFASTLRDIAEGRLDVAPMITGEVGLDGVPAAFETLGHPDQHCKILVVP